ncbi:hypothetical protein V6N13_110364 [Hibiscus sabdariffa]
MENPSLNTNPSNVVPQGGCGSGSVGEPGYSTRGRPPNVVVIDGLPRLVERPGSPIPQGLQPESKRGRRTTELMNNTNIESCAVSEGATDKDNSSVEQRNPQELYGPWMQVVNKRRKNMSTLHKSGL